MNAYLPISILAYGLGATTVIIDKILLRKQIPNPTTYVFYLSILGFLVLILIPFGVIFEPVSFFYSILSGILFNLGLLLFFQALRAGEASVVQPVVGSLNPLFSLIIGWLLLSQALTNIQFLSFVIIIAGTLILTYNLWISKLEFNKQLLLMFLAGVFFALSYITLREAFLQSNFLTGLTVSRLGGGLFALTFLFFPQTRREIFSSKLTRHHFANKLSLLLFAGQTMGAVSGLLITYAVSLTNPALVNSLFGIQYLVILGAALFLAHEHRSKLLDERLTKGALVQKFIGSGFLSLGVYLLSK